MRSYIDWYGLVTDDTSDSSLFEVGDTPAIGSLYPDSISYSLRAANFSSIGRAHAVDSFDLNPVAVDRISRWTCNGHIVLWCLIIFIHGLREYCVIWSFFEGQGLRARLCCRKYLTPYFGYIILPHVDWPVQCLAQRKSQKKYTKRKDRKKIRDENISSIVFFIYWVKGLTNATSQDVGVVPKTPDSKIGVVGSTDTAWKRKMISFPFSRGKSFFFYACVIFFSVRDLWEFLLI